MSRIGLPLVEETGKPRVTPRTLPVPTAPAPEPAKKPVKEPVKVGTPAENIIHRVAGLLGVSDDWVTDRVLEIAARINTILNVGASGSSCPVKARRAAGSNDGRSIRPASTI